MKDYYLKKKYQIFLDFPADEPIEQEINNVIRESVEANIQQLFKGRDDYLAILDNEASIRNISCLLYTSPSPRDGW